MKNTFGYKGEKFYWSGQEIQIRSGAIHYFRIPKAYWYDRLLKLKECGFNCVETYVAWNVHERKKDEFDFLGKNQIVVFESDCAAGELEVEFVNYADYGQID